MHIRLYKVLDKLKCLYKKGFGFRNFHLTNHALVSVTKEIKQVIIRQVKDKFACGVFKGHSIQ